jgi:hypothetical protein
MNKVAKKEIKRLKKLKIDKLDIYFTIKKLDDKVTFNNFFKIYDEI